MCGARSHTPFSLILVFSLTSSLPRSPPPFNESLISVYVNANDTVCHCVQSSLLAFKPGTFTTVNLLGGGANVFTGRGFRTRPMLQAAGRLEVGDNKGNSAIQI